MQLTSNRVSFDLQVIGEQDRGLLGKEGEWLDAGTFIK